MFAHQSIKIFFLTSFFGARVEKYLQKLLLTEMDIMNNVYAGWRDLMDNKSDPRTRNWFMMDSPLPTIAISATYIFAVKVSFYRFDKVFLSWTFDDLQDLNRNFIALNLCSTEVGLLTLWRFKR